MEELCICQQVNDKKMKFEQYAYFATENLL